MVCLGNICRSPLAEAILQDKAFKAGLTWTVESAGTGTWHIDQPPHHLSRKVAALNGIDIGRQICRQFRKEDMLDYDLIYVMDENNYFDIKTMSRELWNENKVEFLLNELHPGQNRSVPDPYSGTEADYHEVYKIIEEACDKIIKKYSIHNIQHTSRTE